MRSFMKKVTVISALLVIVISTGASGQPAATRLSGAVTDPMSWVVPETTVVLRDTQTNKQWKNRTDATGRYTFNGLRDGEYVLEIERAGFNAVRQNIVVVGPETHRELQLQLGSASEQVMVTTDSWDVSPQLMRTMPQLPRTMPLRRLPKAGAPKCGAESIANRTGGQVVEPRKTGHANPIYPAEAVANRREGRSRVEGVISAKGTMTNLTVLESTSPEFARAALDAVSLWEFDPKYLNCVPVETKLTVTMNFRKQ